MKHDVKDIRDGQPRLPIGAEVLPEGGVRFRVWAPRRKRMSVVLEGGPGGSTETRPLTAEEGGYFSGVVPEAADRTAYRFRCDDDPMLYPDPASRFQPEGPDGPSQVVDPSKFSWTDEAWPGVRLAGQVIYEMHIGTFTPEGTWEAAGRVLPELAEMGITLLEVMPVAEFAGRFGWGYDGVDLFAPTRLYGSPDDLRRFVDTAHRLGLGVILDVVYNHLGPSGNFLKSFSLDYFTDRYQTDWGEAINFDGNNSAPVREFFVSNAEYWIGEYHLDGLRFDATDNIIDRSAKHIITEIAGHARRSAGGRSILLIAENEAQNVQLIRPAGEGGFGLDAVWNDDFHHSAIVALQGQKDGYYTDYPGSPQEFISALKWGYLYQGQYYSWQKKRRGTPTYGIPPGHFVHYIQNHDQVANSARGERVHRLAAPGDFRAMTALFLLGPQTPMLFQGQEYCAPNPFCYFADPGKEIGERVRRGRSEFLKQFKNLRSPDLQEQIPDPIDPQTFARSKLDPADRKGRTESYLLHRDLLRLRKRDEIFRQQRADWIQGAVLGPGAFVIRFLEPEFGGRLLVINFGRLLALLEAPEPLLAPPEESQWEVLWSSEWPRYGGSGTPEPDTDEGWFIPGHAAVVLAPKKIVLLYRGERFFD